MSQVAKGEGLCAEGTPSAKERIEPHVLTQLQALPRLTQLSLSTRPSRSTRSPRTSSPYTTRPCPRRCWRSWRRWSPWTPVLSWVGLSPERAVPTTTALSKHSISVDHQVQSKTAWTRQLRLENPLARLGCNILSRLHRLPHYHITLFLSPPIFQSPLLPASTLHYSLFFMCALVYVLGFGLGRWHREPWYFSAPMIYYRFPVFCISHHGQETETIYRLYFRVNENFSQKMLCVECVVQIGV